MPIEIYMPRLMKNGPPWTEYGELRTVERQSADTGWREYTCLYKTRVTAHDARLTFYFGGLLPAGVTVYIDSLSLRACLGDEFLPDIGNIIFDLETQCGVKVFNESELDTQGEFWFDKERRRVKLYSSDCPSRYYSDIEFALNAHIIDQDNAHHVVYENLALKYGGAHGIGGGNTHHIIVRNCELSYIGGGELDAGVRFGNGIEFWGDAHDNIVERCRLWEIYDAALTNQSSGPDTEQYNIYYRGNVIWNCEYSFEYWNRPQNSETRNIRFEDNTCVNAGHGWGHVQRPDPSGRHLCFYTSPAPARDIYIRNNIFYEAAGNAFYAPTWRAEAITGLTMDNNCWFQMSGEMIVLKDQAYTMGAFAQYRTHYGQDSRSIAAVPRFVDLSKQDFHLSGDSPCIDAGTDVGLMADCEGTPIPHGAAPDIGAYESRPQSSGH